MKVGPALVFQLPILHQGVALASATSVEGSQMTITIRVMIDGHESVEEVAHFERDELQAGNLGLTLVEAKSLLSSVQRTMIGQQTSTGSRTVATASTVESCFAEVAITRSFCAPSSAS